MRRATRVRFNAIEFYGHRIRRKNGWRSSMLNSFFPLLPASLNFFVFLFVCNIRIRTRETCKHWRVHARARERLEIDIVIYIQDARCTHPHTHANNSPGNPDAKCVACRLFIQNKSIDLANERTMCSFSPECICRF